MRSLTLVSLGLIFTARHTRCENRFRQPPGSGPASNYRDNPSYRLGSQVDLEWDTDFEAIDLLLWHQAPYNGQISLYTRIFSNIKSSSVPWTVSYSGFPSIFDSDLSPVYYIQMYDHNAATSDIITCHYFNITDPSSSTTSASVTPTSTILQTASTSALSGPDPSSSPSPRPEDKGLPNGAVAGIAVGGTLVALIVASLVGWMFWKRLQKKKAEVEYFEARQDVGSSVPGQWKHGMPVQGQKRYEADGFGNALHELPADTVKNARHELQGEQSPRL
ncbi:hypothetical protein LZ30DRAFT_731329 [Colletotrichum cereale]|nr:hypothetical protein LZ30DRAFT_731329 [Colletotrichum cereale]